MNSHKQSSVQAILSAPLVDLQVSDKITKNTIPIGDGADLIRPPLIKLNVEHEQWLGELDRSELHKAEWGIRYRYDADAKEYLGKETKVAENIVSFITAAIWITKPVCAGVPFLLHFRSDVSDGAAHNFVRLHTKLRPLEAHGNSVFTDQDVIVLQSILPKILRIHDSDTAITRSIRYMLAALHGTHAYPRIAMMTSALESIFTTDSSGIAHKVAERVALLVEQGANERHALYLKVKKIYQLRSSVVHGSSFGRMKDDQLQDLGESLETLVGKCLRLVLESEVLLQFFGGSNKKREQFLAGLPFNDSSW